MLRRMSATTPTTARDPHTQDQWVTLRGISWRQYDALMAMRGDQAGVRIAYLDGVLEFRSPSHNHEWLKKLIARLLEAYAEECQIELTGYGSWTVRRAVKARGVEPDECYVLGTRRRARPDLAIEVVWTEGGLDKLEIYRGLGVPEVWVWREGTLAVHVLRGTRYQATARSLLFPNLDLARFNHFLGYPAQTAAVRAWRRELRTTGG